MTNTPIAPLALILTMAMATSAQAVEERRTAFAACPIVQDTPTVPCWLAEYEGVTYYMGIQTDVSADFNPPSLGHKVLVEGVVTDKEVCGAKVIDPVNISILPEMSPECDEMRVPIVGVDLGFESPRPPGPSMGRLAFQANFSPPAPPQPPYEMRVFNITYSFEGMVGFTTPRTMRPALDYANLSNAKKINLRSFRTFVRLDDGSVLTEHEGIARERVEEIKHMFTNAGLEDVEFILNTDETPIEGGPELRRVEVTIIP